MSYSLSRRSRDRMKGVHPALVAVIEAAIERSPVDFSLPRACDPRPDRLLWSRRAPAAP